MLATGLLAIAAQYQWIAPLRYCWALNLWQYLPVWLGGLLATAALALCVSGPRAAWTSRFAGGATAHGASTPVTLHSDLVVFGACWIALWLLRDGVPLGDAGFHLAFPRTGGRYVFPDLGTSYLLGAVVRLADATGLDAFAVMQIFLAGVGAATVASLRSALGRLCGDARDARALLAFALSGGLLRVLAGHVEVYALVLLANVVYLWGALAYRDGRVSLAAPSIALGVGVWLHASAICLAPSLLYLAFTVERRRAGGAGRAFADLATAAAPMLGFLAYAYAAEPHEDWRRLWESVERILAGGEAAIPVWVRGWGGEPSLGTDVVFLGASHLKYLANAVFLLAPLAAPVLVWGAARGRLAKSPTSRFLLAALVPYAVYTLSLRPVLGPWDWDLFSTTALWSALLAGRVVAEGAAAERGRGVLGWLAGLGAVFVGIPFLLMGVLPLRDAGPFAASDRYAHPAIVTNEAPAPPALAPWL